MIPGLNGIRAIAFLLVFAQHTGYLKFGWVGVQLFFVLSGFLITDILLRMKAKLGLGVYLKTFYIRRILRIFPLYYFYITAMVGIATWLISIGYKPVVMSRVPEQSQYAYFFFYNIHLALKNAGGSEFFLHLWSLSIEEQFYLVWPLIIFITPGRYLKKLFILGGLAGPLFRLFFYFVYENGYLRSLVSPASLAMYTLPFTHIDAFAMGAYITRHEINNARQKLLALTLVTVLLGEIVQFSPGAIRDWSSLGYPVTMPDHYQFVWGYSLINALFILLIYCVMKNGLWSNILNSPIMDYFGRISYGLYVYHLPLIWFSYRFRDIPGWSGITPLQSALISFCATILIAMISFHTIEKPIIKLKDRLAAYDNIG